MKEAILEYATAKKASQACGLDILLDKFLCLYHNLTKVKGCNVGNVMPQDI